MKTSILIRKENEHNDGITTGQMLISITDEEKMETKLKLSYQKDQVHTEWYGFHFHPEIHLYENNDERRSLVFIKAFRKYLAKIEKMGGIPSIHDAIKNYARKSGGVVRLEGHYYTFDDFYNETFKQRQQQGEKYVNQGN